VTKLKYLKLLEENGKPFNEFMLKEMCQIYPPDVIEFWDDVFKRA